MKLSIGVFALILACLGPLPALAVERGVLPAADDLRVQGKLSREKQIPVLILFSDPGCPYCARVRDEFLIPTTLNQEYDDRVILLEVEVGGSAKLIDFDGNRTTHGRFAQRHRVGFTPTVKLFDARGRELTEPLIGFTNADFYGGYLEQAIIDATARLRLPASAKN